MRFSELHLIRYGQFDGCRLVFPASNSDLHVVYGPNEAGKSTTMSAVADLIFGFPHAVGYDFQFDKLLLRVGGVIEGATAPMTCRRKRGNVRTLMDAAEQPLEEASLTGLLAGQTRETFLRAFSLDHTRLREGGRAMLESKDDVGQAIFAAGSGLVGVSRLVESLEEEAKAIWTKQGATKLYNVAQRTHEEAKTRLRQSQLKSAHWAELKKRHEIAEQELHSLRDRRAALQAGLQKAERRRRIVAPVAAHLHSLEQLESMGPTAKLPADAQGTLSSALRHIAESEAAERIATDQSLVLKRELDELELDTSLLTRRDQVTALRAEQGAVDKAMRDTPALKARAASATAQLHRLLTEVGWETLRASVVQARLPGRPQVAELRALLEEQQALEATRSTALLEEEAQADLSKELERQIGAATAIFTVGAAFTAVVRGVRAHGDIEAALRTAQDRQAKAQRTLQSAMAALAPWSGSAADLSVLPVPSETEANRLAEALAAARSEVVAASSALAALVQEDERLTLRRSQLLRDAHAVSPERLKEARDTRDVTWATISAHLSGEVLAAQLPDLQVRFPSEIQTADELADRRFDDAENSAALLGIDQERERVALHVAQAEAQQAIAETRLSHGEDAWVEALRPVSDRMRPDSFGAWRTARLRALEFLEVARTEADEVARLTTTQEGAIQSLLVALPARMQTELATSSLKTILLAAEGLERASQDAQEKRAAREAGLSAANDSRQRAESRRVEADRLLLNWRERWELAVKAANLDANASLQVLRGRLDLLEEIRSIAEAVTGFERRAGDIEADVDGFNGRIQLIARDFGIADSALDGSATLTVIEKNLAEIAALAEQEKSLKTQLLDAEQRIGKAREADALARGGLAPLLAAAGVQQPLELEAAIQRSERAKALQTEIESLERQILQNGDGLDLEALMIEASGATAAELGAECQNLQEQLDSLTAEVERFAEEREAARIAFAEADDRPDAALAAEDQAQAKAEMETLAELFVRKRAEAALLRWTIDRYRREKQAPLLQRASGIFSELTLRRYSALGVDIEDGRPKLSGMRDDGRTVVPVSGMSDGTLDQLFLSLRLAAVEESVVSGIRLPFLADDLFINYDDARSAAGFRVLARLAEQTQVLFFTHHEHLAELARQTLGPSNVSACKIGDLKMEAA